MGMAKAVIHTIVVLMFALGILAMAGCATGERQRGYYSGEPHQEHQYIPPRPYTAA